MNVKYRWVEIPNMKLQLCLVLEKERFHENSRFFFLYNAKIVFLLVLEDQEELEDDIWRRLRYCQSGTTAKKRSLKNNIMGTKTMIFTISVKIVVRNQNTTNICYVTQNDYHLAESLVSFGKNKIITFSNLQKTGSVSKNNRKNNQ